MIENNPSKVSSPFEMLLKEVKAKIGFVKSAGANAFRWRDDDKAKDSLQWSGTLMALREGLLKAYSLGDVG